MKRVIAALLVAAGLVWALSRWLMADNPPWANEVAAAPRESAPRSLPLAGTSSCAGRSCHGSLEPIPDRGSWQIEYTRWLIDDPHRRAHAVLKDPLAQAIAKRLGINDAQTAPECLSCHVTPALAQPSADAEIALWASRERPFGVGCEACHGRATAWLDEHLTAGWQAKSARDKQKLGMTALSDAAELTRTCAGCHVGAAGGSGQLGRDVNHDLIAAGHPRLAFEMTSFLANLPRHWDPQKTKPHDDARLWAIGQVVSAEVSLELLAARLQSNERAWPEFAEYDCASCHHQLASPSWRQTTSRPGRRPGALAWGTWSTALPHFLADRMAPPRQLSALTALQSVMEQPGLADAGVSAKVAPALAELAGLRGALEAAPPSRDVAAKWLALLPGPARDLSWDVAEQTYLAAYALNQVARDPALQRRLDELMPSRAWPSGYASPRDFDPHLFMRKLRE